MRRLLFVSMLLSAAACSPNQSTGPLGTIIRLQLHDDTGVNSGGRNHVLVTQLMGEQLDAHTDTDGVADVLVPSGGTYTIRVIPRAGFIDTASLLKTITVQENITTVVEFRLNRQGQLEGTIEPPGNN